jgi:hypothetical protein
MNERPSNESEQNLHDRVTAPLPVLTGETTAQRSERSRWGPALVVLWVYSLLTTFLFIALLVGFVVTKKPNDEDTVVGVTVISSIVIPVAIFLVLAGIHNFKSPRKRP